MSYINYARSGPACQLAQAVFSLTAITFHCNYQGLAGTPPAASKEPIMHDAPSEKRFQTVPILGMALVHFIHDLYTSFLAPLLPLLIERLKMSMTQAGTLWMFLNLPSLFNPFLGYAADRWRLLKPLIVISPAVTALFMGLIGVAPHFVVLVVFLLLAGVSVAALHVSAPVIVSYLAGDKVGRGMSFHQVSGELARSLGPVLAVSLASWLTLEGLWLTAPVGIAASLVLWWRLPEVDHLRRQAGRQEGDAMAVIREMKWTLLGVGGILTARSFMVGALGTFLPTLLYGEGHSLSAGGISLAIFEFTGAVGALVAGPLSDRIGRRKVLMGAIVMAPLATGLFVAVRHPVLMVMTLALTGLFVFATMPVMMALVMEQAGSHRSTANGVFTAMSFAIRASIVVLVGLLGDLLGLRTAFLVCAVIALAGIPFAWMLPRSGKQG